MSEKPNRWFALSVTVEPEYVAAMEFAFNTLESLGSEVDLMSKSDCCTVTAYFLSPPDEREIRDELANAARVFGLEQDTDFGLIQTIVEEQDWLAEWKKHWKPVEIGRFVIAAPWHELDSSDRVVIRIEPNMAFGTGTHETTQLCLAAIDQHYRRGQSFLDVGTGTGILAIAASLVSDGTETIAAIDTDPEAVAIAQTNAESNGVGGQIRFSTGSVDVESGNFDFVCANLTADVILPILPALIERSVSTLVLSGILAEQEDMVLDEIPNDVEFEVSRAGEWIAVVIGAGWSGRSPDSACSNSDDSLFRFLLLFLLIPLLPWLRIFLQDENKATTEVEE